jgi:parallel beta-helix repeat protein
MLLDVRAALTRGTGVIVLPAGETHLTRPLEFPKNSRHVTLKGSPAGSTLVMDAGFAGSAAVVVNGAADVTLSGFSVRGNRKALKSDWYLPTGEMAFADFYTDNGIVVRKSSGVVIRDVRFRDIRAFPVLVNASSRVTVDAVRIEDCGTLNRAGRNNTTGGILLEEGVSGFEVRNSSIRGITGNAIWTHSYTGSPRQSDGFIRGNTINTVGRDAIQVGHATRVRVEENSGAELGYPTDFVDVENHGIAVALDTAGNVEHTVYTRNRFTDVNGQCIDLDGFHDGEVTENSCVNRKPLEAYPASHYAIVFGNNNPDMESTHVVITGNTVQGFAYGGLFLAGSNNRVENNRFLDLNRAHCGSLPLSARCNYAVQDQPELLRSGIYLAGNAGRPTVTKDNVIRGNTVTGFGMKEHCVAADPGVDLSANLVGPNSCEQTANLANFP